MKFHFLDFLITLSNVKKKSCTKHGLFLIFKAYKLFFYSTCVYPAVYLHHNKLYNNVQRKYFYKSFKLQWIGRVVKVIFNNQQSVYREHLVTIFYNIFNNEFIQLFFHINDTTFSDTHK